MEALATRKELRLDIQQSWWSMNGLGSTLREWTIEEKFEKIAEAGFTGIQAGLPADADKEKWRKLLDEYSFSFGTGGFPSCGEGFEAYAKEAVEFGASYINSQVMDSFVVGEAAVSLLRQLNDIAKEVGIPHYVETHRGRITQDLLRTSSYVDSLPELRLTIDFSHYIVAGEMDGFATDMELKAEEHLDKLLRRASSIHGRISNGQQIQIISNDHSEDPNTLRFLRWWATGMRYWMGSALNGESFPFVCEIGPAPYEIPLNLVTPSDDPNYRWQQSLRMKKLAEQAWSLSWCK
ncbi:sugar phosphate isomerase/epimerase family protein [Cohnella herbarum]|uniref:Sugar phosphate isomerase/epimerase n=1 Tax=Cohnella herbarum TaxID=2728023 RepID=A0A7Z2ZKG3_9BACL|nr:TIM barrel protein [Cohnella herbarum]QJD82072.1 sugar phosphate isomerase/epimerase [Cohnella herbarum]